LRKMDVSTLRTRSAAGSASCVAAWWRELVVPARIVSLRFHSVAARPAARLLFCLLMLAPDFRELPDPFAWQRFVGLSQPGRAPRLWRRLRICLMRFLPVYCRFLARWAARVCCARRARGPGAVASSSTNSAGFGLPASKPGHNSGGGQSRCVHQPFGCVAQERCFIRGAQQGENGIARGACLHRPRAGDTMATRSPQARFGADRVGPSCWKLFDIEAPRPRCRSRPPATQPPSLLEKHLPNGTGWPRGPGLLCRGWAAAHESVLFARLLGQDGFAMCSCGTKQQPPVASRLAHDSRSRKQLRALRSGARPDARQCRNQAPRARWTKKGHFDVAESRAGRARGGAGFAVPRRWRKKKKKKKRKKKKTKQVGGNGAAAAQQPAQRQLAFRV